MPVCQSHARTSLLGPQQAAFGLLMAVGLGLGCSDADPTEAAPEQGSLASQTQPSSIEPSAANAAPEGSSTVTLRFNHSPVVRTMTADPSPLVIGAESMLNAQASDADGDALTYEWSSNCTGRIRSDGRNTFLTLLAASPEGGCTLHVVVRDGLGGVGKGDLLVPAGATPIVVPGSPTAPSESGEPTGR